MSWFGLSSSSPLVTPVPSAVSPYPPTKWQAFWEIFKSFLVYILLAIFVIWVAYSYSKYGMDKKIMGGCGCGSTTKFWSK